MHTRICADLRDQRPLGTGLQQYVSLANGQLPIQERYILRITMIWLWLFAVSGAWRILKSNKIFSVQVCCQSTTFSALTTVYGMRTQVYARINITRCAHWRRPMGHVRLIACLTIHAVCMHLIAPPKMIAVRVKGPSILVFNDYILNFCPFHAHFICRRHNHRGSTKLRWRYAGWQMWFAGVQRLPLRSGVRCQQ